MLQTSEVPQILNFEMIDHIYYYNSASDFRSQVSATELDFLGTCSSEPIHPSSVQRRSSVIGKQKYFLALGKKNKCKKVATAIWPTPPMGHHVRKPNGPKIVVALQVHVFFLVAVHRHASLIFVLHYSYVHIFPNSRRDVRTSKEADFPKLLYSCSNK